MVLYNYQEHYSYFKLGLILIWNYYIFDQEWLFVETHADIKATLFILILSESYFKSLNGVDCGNIIPFLKGLWNRFTIVMKWYAMTWKNEVWRNT